MHPREGKDKWFSAHPLIPGIRDRQLPEAALICNFPEPKEGNPGLLQYSDVVTFFHEFGHLMHALLGGRQAWAGISGIATEGDFVEVPSQMLEEFFRDPRLLASFALHYETDEPIPAELVLRMNRAGAFGRADWVRSQLFYTTYSLETHRLDPASLDPDALFRRLYERFLPYEWIDGNRMYASFTHLDRLLVELLHVSLRQGDRAGLLRAVSAACAAGFAGGDAVSQDGAGAGRVDAGEGNCAAIPGTQPVQRSIHGVDRRGIPDDERRLCVSSPAAAEPVRSQSGKLNRE